VVVADADVLPDPGALESAVRAVTCGAAAWAMPHGTVLRLTESCTDRYVRCDGIVDGLEMDRKPYPGVVGGGVVVGHRDTFLDVPIDPRFEGWGGEDESWGLALGCLLGPAWRSHADLIHLWHPAQPRESKWGGVHNRELRRRYGRAGLDPDAMRLLIEEAHAAF
jgi:hypothetical protein